MRPHVESSLSVQLGNTKCSAANLGGRAQNLAQFNPNPAVWVTGDTEAWH